MNPVHYGPAEHRRAASSITVGQRLMTPSTELTRSIEMYLINEDLARAQLRERYRQAHSQRLAFLVSRVRRAHRLADEAARLSEHLDATVE